MSVKDINRISFPAYMQEYLRQYVKTGVIYIPTIRKEENGVVVIELREADDGDPDT